MVLFLLNIIFLALGTLSNLVFRIIFNVTTYMLVLVIQSFKVPGEVAKGALEQVADVIKLCVEYLVEFAWEAISSLLSALFDLVKEGVFGSVVATGSAIGGLLEHMRNSMDGFLKELIPEVLEGFSEMISTIVTDFWNNYKEAVGYVTENA
ncbi:hypothetical protein Acr_15g0004720 [Actinidia rufa]|uniref:Uncharacterized protein n=1 Tax=Actinidia rufa TaxID=165716 RepID=A0A7J0FT42_9ERIC|nr:hypothetical protein Acr_15g0004720 [Actinidia rufa]